MATSVEIRGELVEELRIDLVGPDNNHAFANELLPEAPSRWYLTGFLVPTGAPIDQRTDETATEEIDSGGDTEGTDDSQPPDRAQGALLLHIGEVHAETASVPEMLGDPLRVVLGRHFDLRDAGIPQLLDDNLQYRLSPDGEHRLRCILRERVKAAALP